MSFWDIIGQPLNKLAKQIQQNKSILKMDISIFFDSKFKENLKKIKKKIILLTLSEISQKQEQRPKEIDISSFKGSNEYKYIEERSKFIQQQLESHSDQKNTKEWNLFSFYYFIITYFLDKANYNYESYGPTDNKLKSCIQYIMETLTNDKVDSLINNKVEYINETTKEKTQIDYEDSYESQTFTPCFLTLKEHEYNFEKFQLERIKLDQQELQDEEDFLNDWVECYEIWGNMILINQYRNNRVLLYLQFLDSQSAQESKVNLIRKYEISEFKFFDKFDSFYVVIYSEYIGNLKQEDEDEIYFYFLFACILNLLKLDYLQMNKEQKLVNLIEKIKSFKSIKFILGYQFLLRLMIDFQEKLILSESNDDYISQEFEKKYQNELCKKSLVQLFKEWTNEKYEVSEKYINKQQLQLYIDSAKSALILAILPDLVRFYDINEKIPYQPTNIDIGYVQQIIRGKRLYLKNPEEKEKNIAYWKGLIENIENNRIKINEKKDSYKGNQKSGDENPLPQYFCLEICKINLLTLQLLYKSESCKSQIVVNSNEAKLLREQIQQIIKQIGSFLYQSLYRQRQFYKTLCSLLIEENSIMNYLINQIIKNKAFVESYYHSQQFKNLILSFKQDFDIKNIINLRVKSNFSLQSMDKTFGTLNTQLFEIHRQFIKQTIETDINELLDTKQKFENIIKYYGFLNRKKYEVLKLNIKMYIKFVELVIEQKLSSQYSTYSYEELEEISRSQFIVKKVKLKENKDSIVALKQSQDDGKDCLKQQMREISILSNLPKNNLIIQYVGHQKNNKQFEIFLEYFNGQTLQSFINELNKKYQDQNHKDLKLQKLQISKQILQAIEYLHEYNIVHGDIKFTNILINSKGEIKIIDFSESSFMIEETLGYTRGYDAKDNVKTRYVDYYSLGILLIRIFYKSDFEIVCNCQEEGKICNMENHEGFIHEKTCNIDEQRINQYSQNFFDQIKSLLNDQPYLRCTLKELIYIIDLEIEIINNNFTETQLQECKQKYIQKYGQIINYNDYTTNRNIIKDSLYQILEIESGNESEKSTENNNNQNEFENGNQSEKSTQKQEEEFNQSNINEENKSQEKEGFNKKQLIYENNNNYQQNIQNFSQIQNEFLQDKTIKKGKQNQNNLKNLNQNSSKDKLNLEKNTDDTNLSFTDNINKIISPQNSNPKFEIDKESFQKNQTQNIPDQENQIRILESYFIDKIDKNENEMVLIGVFRKLDINFRNLRIDFSKFKLRSREQVKYILEKLVETLTIEKVLSLISDNYIKELIFQIFFDKIFKKREIEKDQKDKMLNYFLKFKE
ncbi:Serine/Threonine kinase domain protein (macronuclear) [Tetrahymena thermophila SB210]|uniref:non-specific serine/threonine protein kinase n=1 Tax=Tetrahymena thermophila (strain SB210) TaxID=312017 RepID=I7MFZ3_TETTS|nr:Serine/Threonine kinase domain protein [Tetrahymena thermophila SB210]EAR84606.2 Serine/Threonine kinase domain protein [Tetrahymena thermophila SB210]|eukprot:XP_001032269.2 Serine/Threonine kinase domain protein [Tetrahymena thermophila SB210]